MSNVLEAVPPASNDHVLPPTPRPLTNQSLAMEVLSRLGVAVVLGWLAVAVGVVMIVVGYYLVSGTSDVAEQLARFSSACVGGLTFIGVGGLLILTNHYRETAVVVDELRAELAELRSGTAPSRTNVAGPASGAVRGGVVVQVGNGATYHEPGCVFAEGKADATALTADEARALGLRACQVCAPQA